MRARKINKRPVTFSFDNIKRNIVYLTRNSVIGFYRYQRWYIIYHNNDYFALPFNPERDYGKPILTMHHPIFNISGSGCESFKKIIPNRFVELCIKEIPSGVIEKLEREKIIFYNI